MNKNKQQFLNISEAIALTINRLSVKVVSAYPITPQTKIVEKLASLADTAPGRYDFVRAESEFAAISIALGAAAAGLRAYTATSSQGLLMMLEVLYNIAGLRVPLVLTCANRSVSAPLNIWNDHQDAMAARDAGWIMLFAENSQEAVDQHVLAYKLAEKLNLPVMVNVDGFILTHLNEAVSLPTPADIKKFLPPPRASQNRLDPKNPQTTGHLVGPPDFFKFRRALDLDLQQAAAVINQAYAAQQKIFQRPKHTSHLDNGLVEFYGRAKADIVFVAMGSVAGTIKAAVDLNPHIGLLKIKALRPFPADFIQKILNNKKVVIINKSISPGSLPPLSAEVAAALGQTATALQHVVAGLGGQDITVKQIIKLTKSKFNGKITWLS